MRITAQMDTMTLDGYKVLVKDGCQISQNRNGTVLFTVKHPGVNDRLLEITFALDQEQLKKVISKLED